MAAARANGYHQDSNNFRLLLIYASVKFLLSGSRLRQDLEEPTVSVMAIISEVFGSCGGEIDVSVELKDGDSWLCCGLIYLGFTLPLKAAQV